MDVIYPYKSTRYDVELRFSLRSLDNMSHDRVIVAGDKPVILSGEAVHVPVPPMANRYQSSTANIFAAAQFASDQFVVMHDDIFVLAPWVFRHEHRGTISEYLSTGTPGGEYRLMVKRTAELLALRGIPDPLFFGLHTPTVYDRDQLLWLANTFEGERYLLRTLYHNLFPQPCERREDVKMRQWAEPAGDVLSGSDELARKAEYWHWLEGRWPNPSPCEIAQTGKCLVLGYGPTVWDDAAVAIQSGPFDAVIASPEAAEQWPGDVLAIANDDEHADRMAAAYGFTEVVFCGRSEQVAA